MKSIFSSFSTTGIVYWCSFPFFKFALLSFAERTFAVQLQKKSGVFFSVYNIDSMKIKCSLYCILVYIVLCAVCYVYIFIRVECIV